MLAPHEVAISIVILEFMRSPCVLPQVPFLAHNVAHSKVSQTVKSLGIDGVMFMFIEGAENEDFVRFLP
jgi:hypothetical protein